MSNYERKCRLIISLIKKNIKQQVLQNQFKDDVEAQIAMKYGDVVDVNMVEVQGFIGQRDIRWPHIQQKLADELLKYFWVHFNFNLNKRELK